jgi:hypothetical protein
MVLRHPPPVIVAQAFSNNELVQRHHFHKELARELKKCCAIGRAKLMIGELHLKLK